MTEPTTQDVEPRTELLRALDAADKAVSDLCSGKLRWEMRVPAEPDHDPDLIISHALMLARRALVATEGAESREGLDPETVRGALIRSGLVWVIPAKDFDEAVQVVTRELANGPLVLRDPS